MPSRSMSGKRGSIDQGEVLVREAFTDSPGSFQVGPGRLFNGRHSVSQTSPKCLCRVGGDEMVEETPSLTQYLVTGNQRFVNG